jgi:mono/diheme cytochrome c family protein
VGELNANTHLYQGKIKGRWEETIPLTVTDEVMRRGRDRFNIYCATCHGLGGDGNGMMHKRALENEETTWVQPSNYHEERLRVMPSGQIFNTITNGVRNMAAYGPQIPVRDRWAIIAYIRALQRSRHATIDDVPEDEKNRLK